MKKRSLASAIAMLVVSAIVLTSATFAWFVSSDSAKVGKISASVENSNSSLLVSVGGEDDFKASISADDFTGLATELTPVSAYATVTKGEATTMNGVSFGTVAFASNETTGDYEFSNYATATANTEYLKYDFDVQFVNTSGQDQKVVATPNFTAASGFTYGLVKVVDQNSVASYYFFNDSGAYIPLKSIANGKAVVDTDQNSVVSAADTGVADAVLIDSTYEADEAKSDVSIASVANIGGATFDIMSVDSATTTPQVAKVTVYVWAEGQDEDCKGQVSNANEEGFAFSLKAQAAN